MNPHRLADTACLCCGVRESDRPPDPLFVRRKLWLCSDCVEAERLAGRLDEWLEVRSAEMPRCRLCQTPLIRSRTGEHGLCSDCQHVEHRAGRLGLWAAVEALLATASGMRKQRQANIAMRLAGDVGASGVAAVLEIPLSTARRYCLLPESLIPSGCLDVLRAAHQAVLDEYNHRGHDPTM